MFQFFADIQLLTSPDCNRTIFQLYFSQKWTCVLKLLKKKMRETIMIKAVYEMIGKRAIIPVRW